MANFEGKTTAERNMNTSKRFEKEVINRAVEHAIGILSGEGTGHDWWHTYRVWKAAVNINKKEKGDALVVQLAALLHDIEDWKSNQGSEQKTINHATEFLKSLHLEEERINQVCEIIGSMSFKGVKNTVIPKTIEGQIVQDADRLDAIGAMGIARVFTYGGSKQREIHNPNLKPQKFDSKEAYLNNKGTSINHFYEKMLLLKDMMNTKTAKKIAAKRHKFLEKYLEQFYQEWEGIK